MRTRLMREYRFEAAHFLPRVPEGHKCARMHGHSYQLVITLEGEIDPELGWVMDFGALDEQVVPLVQALDHRVLNDLEGLGNPTSELLAVWLWDRLRPALPLMIEVQVAETPSSRCAYHGR